MKSKLSLFCIANILFFLVMPLRGYHIIWGMLIEGIVFFLFTLWALGHYKGKIKEPTILLLIILSVIWLELPIRLISGFAESLFSIQLITNTLLAIVLGYLFHKKKYVFVVLGGFLWLFLSTIGQRHFAEYITYRNTNLYVNIGDEQVINIDNKEGCFSQFTSEYVLLDFWSSSCAVCFEKFPIVQELFEKYKDNEKVEVVSIFTCTRKGEDVKSGDDLLRKRGYSFPLFAISENSPIFQKCYFNAFPHVLILDSKRNVIFSGSIDFAKKKLASLVADGAK